MQGLSAATSKNRLRAAHGVVAIAVAAALAHAACTGRGARVPGAVGRVETLGAPRLSPHAYGRAGDLILHGANGTSLLFAATPDARGHRPLKGALLDVGLDRADRSDPLLWWRPAWLDRENHLHALVASLVTATPCPEAGSGIRVEGIADGVTLVTTVCVGPTGRYVATTTASPLPQSAALADELNPGTSEVLVDRDGGAWEGARPTDFVALGEHGIGFLLEASGMEAERRLVHIATESFPAPVTLRHTAATAVRTFHVVSGDALDALSHAQAASRTLTVGFGPDRGGDVTLLDLSGRPLARGSVARGAQRVLRLPPGFGARIALRDDLGIARLDPSPIEPGATLMAARAKEGTLSLRYRDGSGAPIPAHVLFRGANGTADPAPRAGSRAVSAGRSLYVLDGSAEVALSPGTYELTASHGPTHSLSKRTIHIEAAHTATVEDTLRRVVDTSAWISADFHLHAAHSPDAPVSLEERITSLVCEGVDLAVATDHNRITDYGPSVRAMKVNQRIDTLAGDEITSAGRTLWGHFNAFPFSPASGAPEDAVPAYYDVSPAQMFAAARERGARVLQVNHARMPPRIGYFDLTHLDPRTGHADATFSGDFQAFEAYNGIWLQSPDKIREGARDLVALARRGVHAAATGNSDSHQLLFEEAGYPRTYVHAASTPVATRGARAVEALLLRDTTVSSGPLVEMTVDGQRIGSTVHPRGGSVRVHVKVSAPAWVPVEHVEVWRDDTVWQRFRVGEPRDGVRFETEVDVPFSTDGVVLAWADAETPLPDVLPYAQARAVGFTGIVLVDADGDGGVVGEGGE